MTLRYILPFLILTVTGCSGQQGSEQQAKIDTAKLFNPNNHPDGGAKDLNMFKRAIAVVQNGYTIKLNDKETDFKTLAEAESFIISNKEEIKKDLFFILLMDSTTDFKKALSVINILTKNQITNYKAIYVPEYFNPPESVIIQEPTHIETITKINDSTYLSIEILDKGINVKLNGHESKLKNTNELDLFVAAHKPDIKEILITITKELPDSKFKAVLEVLKKHEFNKFKLATK